MAKLCIKNTGLQSQQAVWCFMSTQSELQMMEGDALQNGSWVGSPASSDQQTFNLRLMSICEVYKWVLPVATVITFSLGHKEKHIFSQFLSVFHFIWKTGGDGGGRDFFHFLVHTQMLTTAGNVQPEARILELHAALGEFS